jgi:predicted SpoU family rRNA methylase
LKDTTNNFESKVSNYLQKVEEKLKLLTGCSTYKEFSKLGENKKEVVVKVRMSLYRLSNYYFQVNNYFKAESFSAILMLLSDKFFDGKMSKQEVSIRIKP